MTVGSPPEKQCVFGSRITQGDLNFFQKFLPVSASFDGWTVSNSETQVQHQKTVATETRHSPATSGTAGVVETGRGTRPVSQGGSVTVVPDVGCQRPTRPMGRIGDLSLPVSAHFCVTARVVLSTSRTQGLKQNRHRDRHPRSIRSHACRNWPHVPRRQREQRVYLARRSQSCVGSIGLTR